MSASPRCSSCSRAYSRTVSRSANRGSPPVPCRCVSRLFSTSDATDRRGVASQTASAASSVKPPAKTERRANDALLVEIEQAEAPVDRGAKRSMALRRVARAAGQDRKPLLQPLEQLRRRKQLHARGRELDRERQVVEARADLRDDGASRRSGRSRGGLRAPARRRARRRRRWGAAARGTPARPPDEAESGSSRDDLRARRCSEPAAELGRRLDDALDVVEDEQDRACRAGSRRPFPTSSRPPAFLQARGSAQPPARPAPMSLTSARSTKKTPSSYSSSTSAASWIARRVLPVPPGPVSVRIRARDRRPRVSVSSRSRPTSGAACTGRLVVPPVERPQRREVGGQAVADRADGAAAGVSGPSGDARRGPGASPGPQSSAVAEETTTWPP